LHSDLAVRLKAARRLQEAEREYHKAIELEPGYSTAHNELGGLLANSGRLAEAEAEFRKAIDLANPSSEVGRLNLAMLMTRAGRLTEAETEYRKVLDVNPAHPISAALTLPYAMLAQIYIRQGRLIQ